MSDIKSPSLLFLKAGLFVAIGVVASLLLLLDDFRLDRLVLLIITVWAFCRAYYFAFYVIEHYVDSTYKFSGLTSFSHYLFKKSRIRTGCHSPKGRELGVPASGPDESAE